MQLRPSQCNCKMLKWVNIARICMCAYMASLSDFIVLFQVYVIRSSGGGGVTSQLHLLLDEAKEYPALTATLHDTRSRHQTLRVGYAVRGDISSDGRLNNFSQLRRDLHIEFDRRRYALLQGCKLHDARLTLPDLPWRLSLRRTLHGPLTFCIVHKVGSRIFTP